MVTHHFFKVVVLIIPPNDKVSYVQELPQLSTSSSPLETLPDYTYDVTFKICFKMKPKSDHCT